MAPIKPEQRIIGQLNDHLYVTIPTPIVDQLHLHQGNRLNIGLTGDVIIATPTKPATEEAIAAADRLIAQYMDALIYLADK